MGPEEIEIFQYATYIDANATCVDDADGALMVHPPVQLADFDSSRITHPDTPIVLTFACVDNAGNRATKQRRVHVLKDRCAAVSAKTGQREFLCPDIYVHGGSSECSVYAVCPSDPVFVEPNAKKALLPAASTPIDAIAPRIYLVSLQAGSAMDRTEDGMLILREYLEQGAPYIDPGCVCLDQNDGDLSDHVGIVGGRAIDTKRTTTEPFVVRYTCRDRAGVYAEEVMRWITVVPRCGKDIVACPDGTCPVDSVCIRPDPTAEEEEETHPQEVHSDGPPTIALVGSAYAEVEGQGYRECSDSLEVSAICDHGAIAHDDVDGDLTPYVEACGLSYKMHGLSGCKIYGQSYPGLYNVTFTVADSTGQEVSVKRFVKILVSCQAGEKRCADGLTCVEEGALCEGDIVPSIEAAAEPLTTEAIPKVTVIGNRKIMLPRFTTYTTCSPGQRSTGDYPCDQGAMSEGADGNAMLICPPDHCLFMGCVGHELWRKGVSACVNAMAPVGTVFNISYAVHNAAGVLASDARTVTIAEPCGEGEHWCPPDSQSGRCVKATCEIVDAMAAGEEDTLVTDVEETPTRHPMGPNIELRTPPFFEQPFAFLFGQAPWLENVGGVAGASPLAPCLGDLDDAFFPDCLAKARDALDGEVTETLHVYSANSECSPRVFVAGLCQPGTHFFHMSAYDNDGNRGFSDIALEIEIVQGWEETYETFRDWIGSCDVYLDPRLEDSSEVRDSIAREFMLPPGRVRLESCNRHEEGGIVRARLRAVVIRSLYDLRRRKLMQFDHLTMLRSGAVTADPRGTWYAQQRSRIASLRMEDLASRQDRATIETNLTAQESADADHSAALDAVAARINDAFFDGLQVSRGVQERVVLRANELSSTSALLDNELGEPRSSRGAAFPFQERKDRIASSINVAVETVIKVNSAASDGHRECRGAHGDRLSYYEVSSNASSRTTGALELPVRNRRNLNAPTHNLSSSNADSGARRYSIAARRLLSHRKALGQAPDHGDAWAGYATFEEEAEDNLFVNHAGYMRPRSLGSQSQLRIVGGVLITQRRVAQEVGCPGRNARWVGRDTSRIGLLKERQHRFKDLYSELPCSTPEFGGAYGLDPMFARLDLPAGVADPTRMYAGGLYNPLLRRMRDAYYNKSEVASSGMPFAFFDRNYDGNEFTPDFENALFDIYLDGTLMQDRANLLIFYLYFGRFLDRRTLSVDIRVLLHNEPADMLVDVRIHMAMTAQGELRTTTEMSKIPIFDYFDGSTSRLCLFVLEVLVAAVAVLLCVNSIGDARRFMHLLYKAVIMRVQRRIVRRRFLVDASVLFIEALKLSIPLCLIAASVVHFVYFFAYVKDFAYKREYRWYDGDGSAAARILLPKRNAEAQPPVEGYLRGAWRYEVQADASERDAYLALLAKVDTMNLLNGWYLILQLPIFLGLAATIVSRFIGLPIFYPYLRTLQRSIPNMATLVCVIALVVVQCAYAFHLLFGYRDERYARAGRAIETLSDYQMGNSSASVLRTMLGEDQGTLVNPFEYIVVIIVRFFFSVVVACLLLQLALAIILEVFAEESHRRKARRHLLGIHKTAEEDLAYQAMRVNGSFDVMRDCISAVLYALGWRRIAAFVFSGEKKWLDPRRKLRGLPGGVSASVSLSRFATFEPQERMNSHPLQTSARERWLRACGHLRQIRKAKEFMNMLIERIQCDIDSKGKQQQSNFRSLIAGILRVDGVKSDTARYLRMNRANRHELVVPTLGLVGERALGEVLHLLHDMALRRTSDPIAMGRAKPIKDSQFGTDPTSDIFVAELEFVSDSIIRTMLRFDPGVDVRQDDYSSATSSAITNITNLLYQFATREDRERLVSTTEHLQRAKHEQIIQMACLGVARRIVHDIGWRAGTEFDRLSGDALVEAALRRARDTVNGMAAVIADIHAMSAEFSVVIQMLRNGELKCSPNAIVSLPSVRHAKVLRSDTVATAWRFGTSVAGVVSEIPWRIIGATLRVMCGGEAHDSLVDEPVDWEDTSFVAKQQGSKREMSFSRRKLQESYDFLMGKD